MDMLEQPLIFMHGSMPPILQMKTYIYVCKRNELLLYLRKLLYSIMLYVSFVVRTSYVSKIIDAKNNFNFNKFCKTTIFQSVLGKTIGFVFFINISWKVIRLSLNY